MTMAFLTGTAATASPTCNWNAVVRGKLQSPPSLSSFLRIWLWRSSFTANNRRGFGMRTAASCCLFNPNQQPILKEALKILCAGPLVAGVLYVAKAIPTERTRLSFDVACNASCPTSRCKFTTDHSAVVNLAILWELHLCLLEMEPVAFLGGMFAGLLRLDLNEEPLKEWVTRTVEASRITEDEIVGGDVQEDDVPQEIEIE